MSIPVFSCRHLFLKPYSPLFWGSLSPFSNMESYSWVQCLSHFLPSFWWNASLRSSWKCVFGKYMEGLLCLKFLFFFPYTWYFGWVWKSELERIFLRVFILAFMFLLTNWMLLVLSFFVSFLFWKLLHWEISPWHTFVRIFCYLRSWISVDLLDLETHVL